MTLGSLLAGFLGDHFGRRFTYQFNLMIFGLASLAAAFAPNIHVLKALRFVMGAGLGAGIFVGYGTMTGFAAATRQMDGLYGLCRHLGSAGYRNPRMALIPSFG